MPKSFTKILIANRGEIACRIMRTCRRMGIASVAVYSEADANAPHVKAADEAVFIGAAPARDSYLQIEKIIAAAQKTKADAIHPGYGFLSENAEFAERCLQAGIKFIGPHPEAIRSMGLKSPARKLVAAAGVPVVPGYDGEEQNAVRLRGEILGIGFPVLIKASAGGGGKGMRIVRSADEIDEAIAAAQREAEKSFGNSALLLEKYIADARHIEVQILGDQHGNLVHVFERDCSVQRRHQKIIEESPSPAVNDTLREKLGAAAVTVGQAIHYTNAGTVEFILAPDGEFYFIEVNTRLQVEHPVTEMITGLDLVQLQIEIAEDKPLPFTQAELKTSGHAIEARLYAEDPNHDFLPATGIVHDWYLPQDITGLRIDAGIEQGSEIGIHYDPMLAKLIAHGKNRDEAIRQLFYALKGLSIQGLTTNQEFLVRVLEHEKFAQGSATTNFIAENSAALLAEENHELDQSAVIAAVLYWQKNWQMSDALLANIPPAFRNNPYRNPSVKIQISDREIDVSWQHLSDQNYIVNVLGENVKAEILSHGAKEFRVALDGVQRNFRIIEVDDCLYVHSMLGARTIKRLPRHPERISAAELGSMNAPMPGQIAKILVSVGQAVKAGESVLILEAMKMEQTMRANIDGIIETIFVRAGQIVGPGEALLAITEAS